MAHMLKKANKHYLFSELREMYLKGNMQAPEAKGMWMIFHMTKEAQLLGDKGLTYATWEDFLEMVKLSKMEDKKDGRGKR